MRALERSLLVVVVLLGTASAWGSESNLTIDIEPRWGNISIDGKLILCKRDRSCKLRLPNGLHRIWVTAKEYEGLEKNINLTGDRKIKLQLRPMTASLSIVTSLGGGEPASILVDGRYVGEGTVKIKVAPGQHVITLNRHGHAPYTEKIEVKSGEQRQFSITMQGIPAGVDRTKELLWNIWAENSEILTYQPAAKIELESEYQIYMDLSSIPYGNTESGIYSYGVEGFLKQQLLDAWANSTVSSVKLNVVAVADSIFFNSKSVNYGQMDVDLDKLRKYLKQDPRPVLLDSPLDVMRKGEEDSLNFSFAKERNFFNFKLRTNRESGSGRITFMIFSPWGRPLQQFSIVLCVGNDLSKCRSARSVMNTVTSSNAMLAGTDNLPTPDAVVQFFQLQPDKPLKGLLLLRARPFEQSNVWDLSMSASALREHLENTVLKALDSAEDDKEIFQIGRVLFDNFFPDEGASGKVRDLIFSMSQEKEAWLADRKSIVIQLFQSNAEPPMLVPLGLMVPQNSSGKIGDFLGRRLRVETPLERQIFQPSNSCIDNWRMLLPPEPTRYNAETSPDALVQSMGALFRATEYLDNTKGQLLLWRRQWDPRSIDRIIPSQDSFKDWISTGITAEPSSSIVILGHHDRDAFRLRDTTILADQLRRKFAFPSIAILAACGSAGPHASHIVRNLNRSGFNTLIASYAEVQGYMTAAFLDCMFDDIQKNRDNSGYTIRQSYESAMQCVEKQRQIQPKSAYGSNKAVYGSRALKFQLLGNPYVRICPPR